MIRTAHRTVIAKLLATWLLVLAACPLTAPFPVIDLSEFAHSHPAHAPQHSPAHQMAEAHLRVAPHIVASAPMRDAEPGLSVSVRPVMATQVAVTAPPRPALHAVLRL